RRATRATPTPPSFPYPTLFRSLLEMWGRKPGLREVLREVRNAAAQQRRGRDAARPHRGPRPGFPKGRAVATRDAVRHLPGADERSEEHTSELQSRENLVCRLLL